MRANGPGSPRLAIVRYVGGVNRPHNEDRRPEACREHELPARVIS